MPTLPSAAKILRCTYSGTYGSTKWVNVFHLRYTGTLTTQADADSITASLQSAWASNIASLVHTTCSLTQTTLQDLSSLTSPQSVNSTPHAGSSASAYNMPANVALVVSFKIGRRYRGGHPRMYVPAQVQNNTVNSNQWTGTWVLTAKNAMTAWVGALNAITTTGITLSEAGSLSYYSGHALRPTPVFDPYILTVVHSRVDTMRRRLGKELP